MSLDKYFAEANKVLSESLTAELEASYEASLNCILDCFEAGGRVLVCGNGGSHADSLHFAGELVNFFTQPHRALPVIALGANSAVLTAWANDQEFETQFAREVEAYGDSNCVLIGFSTSGRSLNVINAFRKSKSLGMKNIAFTGVSGSKLLDNYADYLMVVASDNTPRIQEIHIVMYHAMCAEIESRIIEMERRHK